MFSFLSYLKNRTRKKPVIRLTRAEAKQKMDSEQVIVIDVRRPDEFAQ